MFFFILTSGPNFGEYYKVGQQFKRFLSIIDIFVCYKLIGSLFS